MPQVAIFFGSRSDTDKMKGAAACLKEFGITYEAHILSAHRVPEKLEETLNRLEREGISCIIAGAGLAAHLPGVIASKTVLPVIGVPLNAAFEGMDALLSIVQMPKSIPVAAVGVNNSYNAGMLAVQILSTGDPELKKKLVAWRQVMKETFIRENEEEVIL
jgi:5-(carboxyamino)imidazole ribonucleotide mutase